MLKIGLTGGIASGKSLVAKLFAAENVPIIDTDIIARQLTEPGTSAYQTIAKHFGKNILDTQQKLNRQALRQIVFSDPKQRIWLEQLLHPLILKEMAKQAEEIPGDYCILVIPLLIEANARSYVDRVCVVDCPEELQIQRLQERDKNSLDTIKKMLASQTSRQQRLAIADDIIENDKDINYLQNQVQQLNKKYLNLSKGLKGCGSDTM